MTTEQIQIQRLGRETILIPIRGTAPVIVHRMSEKARKKMLDAMQGKKSPKEPKNPMEEFLACFYRYDTDHPDQVPERSGIPAIAFKLSTVAAARFFGKDVPMTGLRQQLFFNGEVGVDGQKLVEIHGEPRMREDVVTVGRGGTDLRYRPEFPEWTATLDVTYVSSMLTRDSVLSLVEAAGMGVGVSEWRPQKNGDFGTFEIDITKEVQVIS